MDNAAGLHDTDVIYADTNPDQIESLPESALHRPVELAVANADKQGQYCLVTYIYKIKHSSCC